jgi:3-hydroxyacyl-[acyl-carrier-protein] dehydratase
MMDDLNIESIFELLPHRPPFLLIDRVVGFQPNKWLNAIKNVTINEPFLGGHFPGRPIMPGVLIIEALAQAATVLIFKSRDEKPKVNTLCVLAGIDKARFRHVVVPGDQLELKVELFKERESAMRFSGVASVGGQVACEAEFMSIRRKG